MSSDDLTQEILDAYGRLVVENYCIIASSVILFADCVFTLTDEVQRIWRRRFTGATLIFLITRWVAVAERIILVTSVVLPTVQDKSCVPVLRFDDVLTDLSYLMFGVFMMLRVRGVWGGGWMPVALIAPLTPIRPIISIYTQTRYMPIAFGAPLYGCGAAFDINRAVYTTLGIVSRATGIAIDAAVLLFTWFKTYRIGRDSRRLGIKAPYITLLLRDGTFYFLIILLIQTLGIISVTVGSDFPLFIVWPYFDQVFTVIFLTRFMLNLRGVYLSDVKNDTTSYGTNSHDHTTMISGIRFSSSVIGNMGAPLHSFSLGSQTLKSASSQNDDDYSHGGRRSWDEAIWEMEDESLETSSDPLYAGLLRDEEESLELGSPSPTMPAMIAPSVRK